MRHPVPSLPLARVRAPDGGPSSAVPFGGRPPRLLVATPSLLTAAPCVASLVRAATLVIPQRDTRQEAFN